MTADERGMKLVTVEAKRRKKRGRWKKKLGKKQQTDERHDPAVSPPSVEDM